jgi:FAD/FMN-containing dehydrogenase
MATTNLEKTTVEAFNDQVRGEVLRPGDQGYDEARSVWNGMIDKEPAVIVRCTGTADVIAAVNFARDLDLLLAVKGGGHNVAGTAVCDDGLMIDLSSMDSVRVDPEAKTARVAPGATWGDFDHEAQAFGLATTGGIDSRTGIAGLTLGGGIGYLARSFGLACDNLIGADVVTAEGELVHASADEHPDLFWGLRGGGGNFGIVTSFEYQLHELGPEVLTAKIFHPFEDAKDVLQLYREFMAEAPDDVNCFCVVDNVPPEPPFPEEYHGEQAIALLAPYAGSIADGHDALAPLQGVGDPILEAVEPMPYTALQSSLDDATPEGERYYWKSHYLEGLSDEAIDTVIEYADPLEGPFTLAGFEPMGGAINRVDPGATAYPHRDAVFNFGVFAGWSDPGRDDEIIGWAREFHDAMAPYSTGGMYTNYLDQDEDEWVRAAYGDNYDRLVEVKNEWDPENLFRLNSNIEPTV